MNRALARPVLATALVCVAAWLCFSELTRHFSAFTSEDARRADIASVPVDIPPLRVQDRRGEVFGLMDDRQGSNTPRVTIVSFMYTRCVSICLATGSSFEQLQGAIVNRQLGSSIRLVTVGIDIEHDNASALAAYARRVHANPAIWDVVSLASGQDAAVAIRSFGVVILRLPGGELEHNAAFHVVDREGRLRAVVDIDAPLAAAEVARSLALPHGASG